MASVRTLDGALRFEPRETPVRRFFSGFTTYLSAMREASEAAHTYEELVRRGIPHQEAVERMFGEHFGGRR